MAKVVTPIKTRILMQTGTKAEWDAIPDFIPLKGEIIIYTDGEGEEDIPLIKIGDNSTKLSNLKFATPQIISNNQIDEICNSTTT